MSRIRLLALSAALGTALTGAAHAQYIMGGEAMLYDSLGNVYWGDPHSTDWYGTNDGSTYNDWYGTGAPTDGYDYAPLTTEDPWSSYGTDDYGYGSDDGYSSDW
jgi:hypothetical protein